MPSITPIRQTGQIGIVEDVEAILLPPNAWSDGLNVEFDDGSVSKIKGHTELYNLTQEPLHVVFWNRPQTQYWVYCTATEVYRVDSAGNVSMIGSGFTTGGSWQSTVFNGGYTLILNNGIDKPHYITYGQGGGANETTLQPLPGWPDDYSCKVIRAAGFALIAGNIKFSPTGSAVTEMAGTVAISNGAAVGGIPNEWAIGNFGDRGVVTTQPYIDTFELSDSSPIQDFIVSRGTVFALSKNSIGSIRLNPSATGTTSASIINTGYGAITTNASVEFDGRVFAVDQNDIYTTDGSGLPKSVGYGRILKAYREDVNAAHLDNIFVVRNIARNQIIVAYPSTQSSGPCDRALVWNYRYNTWSKRELPNTLSGAIGPRRVNNAFDEGSEYFVFNGYASSATSSTTSYLMLGDTTDQFNGENFTAFVERKNMDMGDLQASKWSGEVHVVASGTSGLNFQIKGSNIYGDEVDLTAAANNPFNISKGNKVNPRSNGKLFNIRMTSTDSGNWTLAGYSLYTEEAGRRGS